MKEKYLLNLENPCQKAQWANMTRIESGKFCSLCSKNVVDFSVMSDAEIIKIIENPSRDICAKLSPLQINRQLGINSQKSNFKMAKILSALLIIGATETSSATETALKKQVLVLAPNNYKQKETLLIKPTATDSLKNFIIGKVIEDGTNRLVKLSTVFIKGTNITAKTDTMGNFKLQIPDDFKTDTIILVVKATGWESDTDTIVYRKDLPITNLIIKKENPIIGEYIITVKRKWWQFWKKKYN